MITDFKLFEKSILTKLGVPSEVMVMLQKSFQLKYETPEKMNSPTKVDIKEALKSAVGMILIVNNKIGRYVVLHAIGYGRNHREYGKYEYDNDGKQKMLMEGPITSVMKEINISGCDVYIIKHDNFKYRRSVSDLEEKKEQETKKQQIEEFKSYFNENISSILNKIYGKRWTELVQAVQDYYVDITKDMDTFLNRRGEAPRHYDNKEKEIYKTGDFSDMAYTLHNFAEKIKDNKIYNLQRGNNYNDSAILSKQCIKDLLNFFETRDDLDFSHIEDKPSFFKFGVEEEKVVSSIEQYGVMKLSTLFGRFIMTSMTDWLREKIGEYSGMNKEMDKYNL